MLLFLSWLVMSVTLKYGGIEKGLVTDGEREPTGKGFRMDSRIEDVHWCTYNYHMSYYMGHPHVVFLNRL